MAKRIFLASDLSSKRREVIDEARSGVAQIRDTDGTALVMLGQGNFAFLRALRDLLPELLRIEVAMALPPSERSASSFGEFAWLMAFDSDDQAEFRRELHESLHLALSHDSMDVVEKCIQDWRRSARALVSDKHGTLRGAGDSKFTEVRRPE